MSQFKNINETNIEFIFYPYYISIRINNCQQMSIAASAQNTMFEKIETNEITKNNEEVTNEEIHDSDDDMIVISIRENYKN